MSKFSEKIRERILTYDGSKGYLLQKAGLMGGECGEYWNLSKPEEVKKVYRAYIEAGSDVIQTNTFPGNLINLSKYGKDFEKSMYEINFTGAQLALEVIAEMSGVSRSILVAGDIGPTSKLMKPSGDLDFNEAVNIFEKQVLALVDGGVDVINFETFSDLQEMRAALIASKRIAPEIPVICCLTFEQGGTTLMGDDPAAAAYVLAATGADVVGTNCSQGPDGLAGILSKMVAAWERNGSVPVARPAFCVKPNAGLPQVSASGVVSYSESPSDFAAWIPAYTAVGARLIGGCCGASPEHVKAISEAVRRVLPVSLPQRKNDNEKIAAVASSARIIRFAEGSLPKPVDFFKEEWTYSNTLYKDLFIGDADSVIERAVELMAEDEKIIKLELDKIPSFDAIEPIITITQAYNKKPIILKTDNPVYLQQALTLYNGVAGVVSSHLSESNRARQNEVASLFGCCIL
ncbi:MAG: homocysteine S-methyltransferase family protein [Clostridiales bacterium]|nr:homocysteine S-methyltransferase family protein [Clostridiales bacterium]